MVRPVIATSECVRSLRTQYQFDDPMIRMFKVRPLLALVSSSALLLAACHKDSSSSTTSPTPTPAAATITENFTATLGVGGATFYSFNFVAYGNINITLTSVGGGGLPDGQTLGIGVGRPGATGCTTTSTVAATPSDTAQLTGTYGPGVYCVRVYDAGTLTGPITAAVTVAHS